MKIIPQNTIFDYMEIEILGDLERCRLYKVINRFFFLFGV